MAELRENVQSFLEHVVQTEIHEYSNWNATNSSLGLIDLLSSSYRSRQAIRIISDAVVSTQEALQILEQSIDPKKYSSSSSWPSINRRDITTMLLPEVAGSIESMQRVEGAIHHVAGYFAQTKASKHTAVLQPAELATAVFDIYYRGRNFIERHQERLDKETENARRLAINAAHERRGAKEFADKYMPDSVITLDAVRDAIKWMRDMEQRAIEARKTILAEPLILPHNIIHDNLARDIPYVIRILDAMASSLRWGTEEKKDSRVAKHLYSLVGSRADDVKRAMYLPGVWQHELYKAFRDSLSKRQQQAVLAVDRLQSPLAHLPEGERLIQPLKAIYVLANPVTREKVEKFMEVYQPENHHSREIA